MLDAVADGSDLTAIASASTSATRRGPKIWTAAELDMLESVDVDPVVKLGSVCLAAGSRTLVYGPPSSTKTLVTMDAAVRVALGGGVALLVQGESSISAARKRLGALARGNGSTLPDLHPRLLYVHGAEALESDEVWRDLLREAGATLVVVDPLAAFADGDENSAADMSAFLRRVSIAAAEGAAVVVVHHSTKGDGEGRVRERGSSALRAWADTVVSLHCDTGTAVVLRHEKEREGAHQAPARIEWSFGDAITATWSESEGASTASSTTTRDAVLDALATGPLTRTEVRDAISCSSAALTPVLAALVHEGRVEPGSATREDARGRQRSVDVVRLVARAGDRDAT